MKKSIFSRRIWAMVTALLLLSSTVTVPVQAAEPSGVCGENLVWSIDEGTLTISGTGEMFDYGENPNTWMPETPWYPFANQIVSIVVEEGVTSLGDYAFCKLWSVNSLSLPDSLTRLGDNALAFLSKVSGELSFSEQVQEFGYRALAGCGVSSVTVYNPKAVFAEESIGYDWSDAEGGWAIKPDFTLYGYTGGTGEAYALENHILFESIGTVQPPEEDKPPVLNHDGCLITPTEAVGEMTWGVNLCSLFMTDPNQEGSTTGYCTTAPFGLAVWTEGGGFEWLAYHDVHTGTFQAEASIQNCPDSENGLFRMAVMSTLQGQKFTLRLEDSKLTKRDGTVISLSSLDGIHELEASNGPDLNGWCAGYFALGSDLPQSDPSFEGATFRTTVTVQKAAFETTADKVNTLYQFNQEKMDQEELTDVYLEQGCNVFRLPVTWTPFVNDETFEIDREWLELVKSEVDYILSRGAYCILNMHSDYLNYSFVGTHWEDQWMEEEYQEYVDRRFAAVWHQIAEYFQDYPQQLIFEPFNEPSMNWYFGVDFDAWKLRQAERINAMNQLFVTTVRNTGGKNTTRFLCLPTADYCNHAFLEELILPDDPNLMVQLHSYSEMEDNINPSDDPDFDYQTEINTLFADVSAFQEQYQNVPVLLGELGITRRNDAYAPERVAYFLKQAEQHGVPCLWWEDGFNDVESTFSMYDKKAKEWDRTEVLAAIQGEIVEPLRLTVSVDGTDYFLTSTLTEDCTIVAGVYDESGRLLDCTAIQRLSSDQNLKMELHVSDRSDSYNIKVFFLGTSSCVPASVPLSRTPQTRS